MDESKKETLKETLKESQETNEKELQELLSEDVKDIRNDNGITYITFEDGRILTLVGNISEMKDFQIEKCNFCGKTRLETYLFENNGSYICQDCTILALETFAQNGLPIDLNLNKLAPDMVDKLSK